MLPPACGREGEVGSGASSQRAGGKCLPGSTQATREEGGGREVPQKAVGGGVADKAASPGITAPAPSALHPRPLPAS